MCHGHTEGGGLEMYLYTFFNLGAKGSGWSVPCPDHIIPGKDPVPIVQEAGWTGVENLVPLGFEPVTVQPVVSCYTSYCPGP